MRYIHDKLVLGNFVKNALGDMQNKDTQVGRFKDILKYKY